MRLEQLVQRGHLDRGTVVFLTNDAGYWRDTGRRDGAFPLNGGSSIFRTTDAQIRLAAFAFIEEQTALHDGIVPYRTLLGSSAAYSRGWAASFAFSILQRVSPEMDPADVIALEGSWKERLHTREHGLNEDWRSREHGRPPRTSHSDRKRRILPGHHHGGYRWIKPG